MSGFIGEVTPRCPHCCETDIEEFDVMLEETAMEIRAENGEAESEWQFIVCPECGTKFKARVCVSAIWETEEEKME